MLLSQLRPVTYRAICDLTRLFLNPYKKIYAVELPTSNAAFFVGHPM